MQRKFLFLSLALLVHFSALSQGGQPTVVTFSAQPDVVASQDEFFCSGSIYAHLMFPQPLSGDHLLEGVWRMPNGVIKEHIQAPLSYSAPGRRMALLWLNFEQESEKLFEREDPERNKIYNGEWQLEVRLDKKNVLTTPIKINCV